MNIYFKQNKYKKWYDNIIANAVIRGWTKKSSPVYTEKHHIIPSSLGGTNDKENLVFLTAREHFICHWLLTKMVTEQYKYKMYKDLHKMTQNHSGQRYFSSTHYEIARKYNSICMKENNPTKRDDVKKKMSIAKLGKKATEETKLKQSKNNSKYWLGKQSVFKGSKFYNNGIEQKMFFDGDAPIGWIQGRLNLPWNKTS
jgi:hypothetical protein